MTAVVNYKCKIFMKSTPGNKFKFKYIVINIHKVSLRDPQVQQILEM